MTISIKALSPQRSAADRWRVTWSLNAPLAAILALQAIVSTLALHNTAFIDEALYIDAGMQINQSLVGGPPPSQNFASYFSGHPYLYPVLAGFLNAHGGLEMVRMFSTLCMLIVTACVYWITWRCFDHTSAIAAAMLFAFQGSTLFLSRLATYDALCLALLGIALVLAVQASMARDPVAAVAMGPLLLLAVGVKYVAIIFVPAIIALMAIRTFKYRGWGRTVLHVALTLGAMAVVVIPLFLIIDHGFLSGVFFTTANRSVSVKTPPLTLLGIIVTLGGLLWLLGCIGMLFTSKPDRLFALALVTASLLAPAYHVYTGEIVSLHKHVDFGLFFVAPLAGYTVSILIGKRTVIRLDRRWVASVVLALIVFISGINQAQWYFQSWPDSAALITTLRTQVRPASGKYLCEDVEMVRYSLEDVTRPYQFIGMGYFEYTDAQQHHLTGEPAYKAAIAEGHFDLIELSFGPYSSMDNALMPALQANKQYHLIAKVPYNDSYGPGYFFLWRKQAN